jgi:hypothetical protein
MDSTVWIDTTLEAERRSVWFGALQWVGDQGVAELSVSEFLSGQEGYLSCYNSSVSVGLIAVVKTPLLFLGDWQAEKPNNL